jgi:hypothetical protein
MRFFIACILLCLSASIILSQRVELFDGFPIDGDLYAKSLFTQIAPQIPYIAWVISAIILLGAGLWIAKIPTTTLILFCLSPSVVYTILSPSILIVSMVSLLLTIYALKNHPYLQLTASIILCAIGFSDNSVWYTLTVIFFLLYIILKQKMFIAPSLLCISAGILTGTTITSTIPVVEFATPSGMTIPYLLCASICIVLFWKTFNRWQIIIGMGMLALCFIIPQLSIIMTIALSMCVAIVLKRMMFSWFSSTITKYIAIGCLCLLLTSSYLFAINTLAKSEPVDTHILAQLPKNGVLILPTAVAKYASYATSATIIHAPPAFYSLSDFDAVKQIIDAYNTTHILIDPTVQEQYKYQQVGFLALLTDTQYFVKTYEHESYAIYAYYPK